jgi:hypothetical protein
LPTYIIYDDACHLKRFVDNHNVKTNYQFQRLNEFCQLKFVVDKLHIKGHKEKWCLEHCDPTNNPELIGVNTVVCEQVNFWLGRFKYIMKHMNATRFNFFLYIISNEYNKIKTGGKINTYRSLSNIKYRPEDIN